jgi:phosphoesterase RecJ-like protein
MSDNERLRERQFLAEKTTLWNIDHHKTNTRFGDLMLIDTLASSTGEIIFQLLKAWEVTFTSEIAEALYVAIVTDTGSFKYQNTTSNTHRIVAELYDIGLDTEKIARSLFHNEPQSKIKLHAACMQDLSFYQDGKVAMAVVSKQLLTAHHASMLETDGLVEKIRDIRGVEMVILLKELNDMETKISMRSIGAVDVSYFAQKFSGGGHKNAAGFSIKDTLKNALDLVISEVAKKVLI